jgi:hypothetical protein
VQPTEGFINYSWLASLGKGKVGGAWFDALDCPSQVFLMQGFQSVLAGAQKLTLFNLGELMEANPVLDPFWQRLDALEELARVVAGRRCRGMYAYKPAHSEPGRDSYLFDYLVTLGLPIEMTGIPPDEAKAVLLSSHAASDPEIAARIQRWLTTGATVVITPGFIEKAGARLPAELLGEAAALSSPLSEVQVESLSIQGKPLQVSQPLTFLSLPAVTGWNTLASFQQEGREVPILAMKEIPPAGKLLLLNVSTFGGDVFDEQELFLAPRQLAVPHWPKELANLLREQIPLPVPLHIDAAPPFGLYLYGTDTLAIANFQARDLPVKVECGHGGPVEITVPAWDVVTKSF